MSVHDPRRRAVLHGVLAAACAIGVPALLPGCRAESPPAQGGAGGRASTSLLPPSVSAVMAKLSRDEAHYQDEPQDGQQCSNCLHFIAASSTCEVVEGEVSPDGWCMLWVRRT